MKKKILGLFIISLVFASCGQLLKGDNPNNSNTDNKVVGDFREITIDSLYQLTLPKYMKEMNQLNDEASLQYANIFKEVYTIVIHEDKQEFVSTFKDYGMYDESKSLIQNYAEAQYESFKETVTGLKAIPYNTTEINGKPAQQVQMNGKVENLDISYVMSYVEGEKNLYMVMGWTLKNRLSKYEDTLEEIGQSLKLIND